MAKHVLPWFHTRSIRLEARYHAIVLLDKQVCDPCNMTMIVPNPVMTLLRLRLMLMQMIPNAFTASNEPNVDMLLQSIAERPTDPSTPIAKQFVSLWQSLKIQDRMATLGVFTHEVCQAESEISELLSWGVNYGLSNAMQKPSIIRWISSATGEFMQSLGKPDAVVVNRIIDARKKHDQTIRKQLQDVLTSLRDVQNKAIDALLSLGIHPIVDEVLRTKNPELLQNLATLKVLKAENSRDVLCAVSRALRTGDMASTSLVNALTNVADAYRSTAGTPIGRCPSLDMLLHKNTGIIDAKMNVYAIGHDDNLNYSYIPM
jgi:hypothetical protein